MDKNNKFYEKMQYSKSLIDEKNKLTKQLRDVDKKLDTLRYGCDHISVCTGWYGPFQYRDTSVCECLFCREKNPETKYRVIEAAYYNKDKYGHGELSFHRDGRMEELQCIAMSLLTENPELTNFDLANNMSRIVAENIDSSKKLRTTPVKVLEL